MSGTHDPWSSGRRGFYRAELGVECSAVSSEGLAHCARLGIALGENLQGHHAPLLHRQEHRRLALGDRPDHRRALVPHRPDHRRLALGDRFKSTSDSACARIDHGAHLNGESSFSSGHLTEVVVCPVIKWRLGETFFKINVSPEIQIFSHSPSSLSLSSFLITLTSRLFNDSQV